VWREGEPSGPDYVFFQSGFVTKFRRRSVLTEALAMFSGLGYRVVTVDAGNWASEDDLHDDVAAALDFPSYYGRNFDALNDCLSDVSQVAYGWTSADTGLVLVIDNIDAFWAEKPEAGFLLFDIFSSNARTAALFGNRMACLVRSDDPWFDPKPVGAEDVQWNRVEWLNSAREGEL